MAVTTLEEVMCKVPELRNRFGPVLAREGPGSCLKALRLVSRQLRATMLAVVGGYTLILHGRDVDLTEEMRFLSNFKLSRLRVAVAKEPSGWLDQT